MNDFKRLALRLTELTECDYQALVTNRTSRWVPDTSDPLRRPPPPVQREGEWRVTRIASHLDKQGEEEVERVRSIVQDKIRRAADRLILYPGFDVYEHPSMPPDMIMLVRHGWMPASPEDVRNAVRDGNIQVIEVNE